MADTDPQVDVTIGSDTYKAYLSVSDADTYLGGMYGAYGDAWRSASSDDDKARAVVSAAGLLAQMPWASGTASDADWSQAVKDANALWAAILIEGSWVQLTNQLNSGVRSMKAGSAQMEYFRPLRYQTSARQYPSEILAMMKQWLASAADSVGLAWSSGTDKCSEFRRWYGVNYRTP